MAHTADDMVSTSTFPALPLNTVTDEVTASLPAFGSYRFIKHAEDSAFFLVEQQATGDAPSREVYLQNDGSPVFWPEHEARYLSKLLQEQRDAILPRPPVGARAGDHLDFQAVMLGDRTFRFNLPKISCYGFEVGDRVCWPNPDYREGLMIPGTNTSKTLFGYVRGVHPSKRSRDPASVQLAVEPEPSVYHKEAPEFIIVAAGVCDRIP